MIEFVPLRGEKTRILVLGVLSKISDELPCPFHMGVPQGGGEVGRD